MIDNSRHTPARSRRSNRPGLLGALALLLGIGAVCPSVSRAGDTLLDVDMVTFLQTKDLTDFASTDPVWDLKSGFSRRLIQIPFKVVGNPATDTLLDNTSIKMSNATFVAWRIEGVPTHGVVVQAAAANGAQVERVARSVKQLPDNSIVGSAFAVSNDGFLLTSNHVLANVESKDRDIYVLVGQTAFPAVIIERSPANDLALLKFEGVKDLVPLPFEDSAQIQPQTRITALGYRRGDIGTDAMILGGSVLDTPSDTKGEIKLFEIDFNTDPGLAGGPIVDEKGQVVALIGPNISSGKDLHNTSLALTSNNTRTILERNGIKVEPAAATSNPVDPGTAASNAAKSVYPILSVSRTQQVATAAQVARVPLNKTQAESAPLLARKITIDTAGHVRWSVEHAIPGGTIRDTNSPAKVYTLRLKRELLSKMAPGNPPAAAPADYIRVQNEYRQKMTAYRELQKAVNDAPDTFEESPTPVRIWAIYDLNMNAKEFTLEGPAPLPWTLTMEQLDLIRKNLTPAVVAVPPPSKKDDPAIIDLPPAAAPVLPEAQIDQINAMLAMMQTGQPLNARASAFVIVFTNILHYVTIGDNGYAVAEGILKSTDNVGRNILIKELYTTLPGSADNALARARLGSIAAQQATPGATTDIIKNIFDSPTAPSSATLSQQVQLANKELANPDGASPRQLIDQISDSAKKYPDTVPVYANGIRFDAMPDDRMDQAISRIVELSTTEPLSQFWLNQKLLGSAEPKVIRRTLEAIQSADTNNRAVANLADKALTAFLGPAPVKTNTKLQVKLTGAIPLDSPNHSILRALSSTDGAIRLAAWDAILRFQIVSKAPIASATPAAPGAAPVAPDTSSITEIYKSVIDAGLASHPTPPQLVDFLVHQNDPGFVVDGLIRIVLEGTEKASISATKTILRAKRTDWQLDQALLSLSFGEREGFAKRVYDNSTGYVPLTTALLRQRVERNPLVIWFAAQLTANGEPPTQDQWVKPAGGEDALLGLVGSVEPDIALASVAALVYNSGGDDRAVRDAASKFRLAPKQDLTTYKGVWAVIKRDMNVAKMATQSGPYRMVLFITQGKAPANAVPVGTSKIDLGVVQLAIEGLTVRMTDHPVTMSMLDELGVGLEKPSELAVFKNPDLNALGIEKVVNPVDLLPRKAGGWSGIFYTLDGHQIEVVFSPAR